MYVSSACVSSAGLSDESVVYVVCECTGEITNDCNEGSEEIEVYLLGAKRLDFSDNPKFNSYPKVSAKALPFFLMFKGLKKIKWPKSLTQKQEKKAKKKQVQPSVVTGDGPPLVRQTQPKEEFHEEPHEEMPETLQE